MAAHRLVIAIFVALLAISVSADDEDDREKGRGKSEKGLRFDFYKKSCPEAEKVIRAVVAKHFDADPSITAGLLRMHFHDCFVRGCDASVLINSTETNQSEKESLPNLTVRGHEIIYEAKEELEKACPATVSCADIISLATRDSVAFAGGPFYELPTGRRDGRVSLASEVDLPSPRTSIRDATAQFKKKGLNRKEMVVLLGAHTVGHAHCTFFSDRLYDLDGTGAPDPTMNSTLLESLKKVCPPPSNSAPSAASLKADATVFLDQGTSNAFDVSYYQQLLCQKGILQFDQKLQSDRATRNIVKDLAFDSKDFAEDFAKAMVKMGSIDVLTRTAGEIRSDCRVINPSA